MHAEPWILGLYQRRYTKKATEVLCSTNVIFMSGSQSLENMNNGNASGLREPNTNEVRLANQHIHAAFQVACVIYAITTPLFDKIANSIGHDFQFTTLHFPRRRRDSVQESDIRTLYDTL